MHSNPKTGKKKTEHKEKILKLSQMFYEQGNSRAWLIFYKLLLKQK